VSVVIPKDSLSTKLAFVTIRKLLGCRKELPVKSPMMCGTQHQTIASIIGAPILLISNMSGIKQLGETNIANSAFGTVSTQYTKLKSWRSVSYICKSPVA
jgi:hypothetical protein